MLRILTLSVCIGFGLLLANVAKGQEIPEPSVTFISKGILCDTEEDVQQYITAISLEQTPAPSSCGMFVPRGPLPMRVEPLYWYEVPQATLLVSKIEAPNGWVQFGWTDWKPVEPPQQDPQL